VTLMHPLPNNPLDGLTTMLIRHLYLYKS